MGFIRFVFSKVFWIQIAIYLILIVIALWAILSYLDCYTLHGDTIEVPDLTDKMGEMAASELDGVQLQAVFGDSIYVKGKREGTVVDQDPKPGALVKDGRKVYLTVVSAHTPKLAFPDLIDLSLRQATVLLESYGFKLGEIIYEPDPCENCVLEARLGGEMLAKGQQVDRGSRVDLKVGSGLSSEKTAVPYLLGLTRDKAQTLLGSFVLRVGVELYDETVKTADDSAKAVVYKQDPAYSEEPILGKGSTVDIFLTTDTLKIGFNVPKNDSIQ